MLLNRFAASLWAFTISITFCLISWNTPGWANPTNPQVLTGSASFNTVGNVLQVTVSTTYTIIQWDDFSIASSETTQFFLPSASSLVINQVVNNTVTESTVDGLLTADGELWVINPGNFQVGLNGTVEAVSVLFSCTSMNVVGDQWYDDPNVAQLSCFFINKGTMRTTAGDLIILCDNLLNEGNLEIAVGYSIYIVALPEPAENTNNLCMFGSPEPGYWWRRPKWLSAG